MVGGERQGGASSQSMRGVVLLDGLERSVGVGKRIG